MNKADLKVQIWQAVSSYKSNIHSETRDLLLADINKIIDQEDLKVDQQSTVGLDRFTALEILVAGLSLRIDGLSETANNHNKRLMANRESLDVFDEALLSQEETLNKTVAWIKGAEERLKELEKRNVSDASLISDMIKVDSAILDRLAFLEKVVCKMGDPL